MVKPKTFIFFSIAIVAILVVSIFIFSAGAGPLSVVGSTTLSLDRVELKSSIPQLDGKAWQITFRSGGLGQSYYGSFSPSEVESRTQGDSRPEESFSIQVEYEDQICNYDISGTSANTPIYDDVKMETWACFLNPSLSDAKEQFGSGTILFFGKDSVFSGGAKQCWAIGSSTKSPVGNLGSPDLESEFTISIDAGSDSASRTFNTLSGSTQGTIGDFAYATWQGNLVSGKSCPDKDPFIPIYVNGVWRVGRQSSYTTYESSLRNLNTLSRREREIAISDIRTLASRAKSAQSFGSLNSRTSLNSASVEVKIQDQLQFPLTTMWIEAESIGIFTPAPEADLFSPNSDCFATGEQGSIEVGIENVGDVNGIWNLFAECESPFKSSRNIQVSLRPGQSTTRLIPISASASDEERGRCVIIAESPSGQEKTSVGVCVKPQVTCEPGESFCSTNADKEVVKKCSSNGATSTIIKTCSTSQFCEDARCVSGTKSSGGFFSGIGDFFSDLFAGIFGFFFAIKVLIVAIGSIITLLFVKDFSDIFDTLEENNTLAWIVSLIVAILVGVVLALFVNSNLLFFGAIIALGVFFFLGDKIKLLFGGSR